MFYNYSANSNNNVLNNVHGIYVFFYCYTLFQYKFDLNIIGIYVRNCYTLNILSIKWKHFDPTPAR